MRPHRTCFPADAIAGTSPQSTDYTDPQFAIEYEIYVNGVLSPLAFGAGLDRDFVYGTAHGDNTFTVKAVDRTGKTSAASNAFTALLWPR